MTQSMLVPPVWGPYPPAQRDEISAITYRSKLRGSVTVPDPYIGLEVPSNNSADTKAFVLSQNKFSRTHLDANPDRKIWLDTLTKSWSYPRFTPPKFESDGYYYFEYNDGIKPQAPVYRVQADNIDSILTDSGPGGELFFDPNLLSEDGVTALTGQAMSPCGKYWAYGISEHGNNWMTIYVRETSKPHPPSKERGSDPGRMDDVIEHNRFFSVSWTDDSKGFFYSSWPPEDNEGNGNAPGLNCKVYYHRLGEKQVDDTLIHEDPEHPGWIWGVQLSSSGQYVLLTGTRDSSHTQLSKIADLQANEIGPNIQWMIIHDSWQARHQIIGNEDSLIYFLTNQDAQNYRVMTFDFSQPAAGFTTLVPEKSDSVLMTASIHATNKLVLFYQHLAQMEVYIYDLSTGRKLRQIFRELAGFIVPFSAARTVEEIYFIYNDFISPGSVYRYNLNTDQGSLFRAMKVGTLDLDEFVTESKFYPSKDGTLIPIFITHPKDVHADGTAPVLMYGYGGFSLPIFPTFSVSNLLFCKIYGGMYVVPGIRGGAEYGESWHREGMREKKQNGFDDFEAAAEWLVAKKYAKEGCVVARGGSNGGLLTAAVANQRPELYGCVITVSGVIDMLRFTKFTFGPLLRSEYGEPEDPEDFDFIYKYSPYHNIPSKDVTMPPMIFFHSDYDDLVSPLHSYKHVAALQHRFPEGPNPVLLCVDMDSGHWAGKSTARLIEDTADQFSFIGKSLGLTMRLPGNMSSRKWCIVG